MFWNQLFGVLCSDSETFLRLLVCCVLIPKYFSCVWCVVFSFQNFPQVFDVLCFDSKTFISCLVSSVLIPKHLSHEERAKHRCERSRCFL